MIIRAATSADADGLAQAYAGAFQEAWTAPEIATLMRANGATSLLAEGAEPAAVVREHPESPLAWATFAEQARDQDADDVTVYAYSRVGYHRSLDLLRRNGWKGHGPVPWSHEPNRGFLRCLALLALAAQAIGELDEADRCATFLRDSSPEAAAELLG